MLSVSAPCPRAKQLTAAFRMICFEQNTVIRENPSWGTPNPLRFPAEPRHQKTAEVPRVAAPLLHHLRLSRSRQLGSRWVCFIRLENGATSGVKLLPMWGKSPRGVWGDPGEDAEPGPWEHPRDAGGEAVLRNNGSMPAISNAYKLFRSLCAALKSDLHKSLECLTEFVNAPAPLGTVAGSAEAWNAAGNQPQTRTGLSGTGGRACCPHAVPKLFFQSQMDPCGLFINCQKLQEMSG